MKKILTLLVTALFLASPAGATWSIVLVDTRTGEVAVGSATCITNEDLTTAVPVILVGRGAGASQAWVASTAVNRRRMWADFHLDVPPQAILHDLILNDRLFRRRQHGIANFLGEAVSYSGEWTDEGLSNVTGTVGTIRYAIQGNVLTSRAVGLAAEFALRTTEGDLGQRLLAAMEAARSYGGDGRCSCGNPDPTFCGSPPDSFNKAAHTGFIIVARIGDIDGVCNKDEGCANGEYYLNLNAIGDVPDPDPVFTLGDMYTVWRAGLAGRPDHILSSVSAPSQALPADGVTRTTVTVALVDVDGVPLTSGGATVAVDGDPLVTVGAVTDHGDGTYSFPVTAGTVPGTARFVITADDGAVKATLYPYFELAVDAVIPLHSARESVFVTQDTEVALTMNVPEAPGGPYLILASASGTEPGVFLGDVVLPLNPDEVFWRSLRNANNFRFRNTSGWLDGAGHAEATFTAPPGLLANLIGRRLDWAALYSDGELAVTPPVGFTIFYAP